VIIERASGQIAVVLLSLLVLGVSPLWQGIFGQALARFATSGWWLAGSALLVALDLVGIHLYRHPPAVLAGLGHDLHRSLFSSSVWPRQLGGSLLVVISYALVFVCAARAIGVTLPAATLLALVPPVLLAMLVPLSVAGWGIREGTAALVRGLVGLPPAQGVAVSMAYGLLVLLASLPGLLWLPGCVAVARYRLALGRWAQGRVRSRSKRVSSPHRKVRARGRRASSRVAMGAMARPGRPEPISRGARRRCNRWSTPASRKRDTVTPPPSISTR
jgi:hypothetical protein